MQMYQTQNQSQKFSFGAVEDTVYVDFESQSKQSALPYNPFIFDLKLVIMKSMVDYEDENTQIQLSNQRKTVFGRKKKKQSEEEEIFLMKNLNAETISRNHFSIDEKYILRDMKSKKGTFLWVNRLNPLILEVSDEYLVGNLPLKITRISNFKPYIEFLFNSQTYSINQYNKIYLIGSHKKCDLIVEKLYEFEITINVAKNQICTIIQTEDACQEHGLWYRLRNDKVNYGVPLENGSIILAQPYVFKVTS